jgi:RNA recognition motif-containing protein
MSTEDEARESIGLLNGALLGGELIVVKEAPPKQIQKTGKPGNKRNDRDRTGRSVATRKEK